MSSQIQVFPQPASGQYGANTASRIVNSLTFSQESVKMLSERDFQIGSRNEIALRYDDCILVLFYVGNTESKNICVLWEEAAAQVAGPMFAACNLILDRKVAEAFARLNSEPNNPLNKFALQTLPFILVYRGGWPKAFYNGERSVGSFIDYSLSLACRADYTEPIQYPMGMQPESNNMMGGWKRWSENPASSVQFTVTNPVREYDPRMPIQPVDIGAQLTTGDEISKADKENQQALKVALQNVMPNVDSNTLRSIDAARYSQPPRGIVGIPLDS